MTTSPELSAEAIARAFNLLGHNLKRTEPQHRCRLCLEPTPWTYCQRRCERLAAALEAREPGVLDAVSCC